MPTGYTYQLSEGTPISFKEFALNCARAFGAALSMREDPSGPIDLEKIKASPCNYYLKNIQENEQKLDQFLGLSVDEYWEEYHKDYRELVNSIEESNKRYKVELDRYQKMLDIVKSWNSPTSEHENFKKFMIEQLEMCMKYLNPRGIPEQKSFKAWKDERIGGYVWSIDNSKKSLIRDEENNESRYKWCKDLVDSLDKTEYDVKVQ